MPRPSIFLKTMRDLRWQVFWYGLGLALMAAFVVYIFPSYRDQMADFEIPEALKGFIGEADWSTGPGFLSAEMFSWTPLILAVFAIMSGTSALAGEEANGTLDLVLAQPIRRRRLFLEKLAGLALSVVLINVLIYAGWLVSVPFVEIDVGLGELAVATLNQLPIILLFQSLSMWAGMALPSRGIATGAVVAFAVVSYVVYYLATIVDALQPVQELSVFYHYHGTEVLSDGMPWFGFLLLSALYVAFAAWALVLFERRDVGVGTAGLGLTRLLRSRPA